jgi:DNA-directed RNA polymerase specialized sigma24 family protein
MDADQQAYGRKERAKLPSWRPPMADIDGALRRNAKRFKNEVARKLVDNQLRRNAVHCGIESCPQTLMSHARSAEFSAEQRAAAAEFVPAKGKPSVWLAVDEAEDEQAAADKAAHQKLVAEIKKLPMMHRGLAELVFLQHLSVAAAAARLDVPKTTCYARRDKIRAALESRLGVDVWAALKSPSRKSHPRIRGLAERSRSSDQFRVPMHVPAPLTAEQRAKIAAAKPVVDDGHAAKVSSFTRVATQAMRLGCKGETLYLFDKSARHGDGINLGIDLDKYHGAGSKPRRQPADITALARADARERGASIVTGSTRRLSSDHFDANPGADQFLPAKETDR